MFPIFYVFTQEQALDSSRQARDKEWNNFMNDVQAKCARIDDAYRQKEQDIRQRYSILDAEIKSSSTTPPK